MSNQKKLSSSNTKCVICGKEIPEKRLKQGKTTCCRNCQLKTPESRQKRSEAQKIAQNRFEVKEKKSDTMKHLCQNETFRQKISKTTKLAMNRLEVRQNLIDAMNRPEVKRRISESNKISQNKPETKLKKSTSIKIALSNADVKQKLLYGVNTLEAKLKSYNTKKQNNSFNSSKPEQYIKDLLEQKFDKVFYQYYSEKYPFNCDFYIPSLDLYIECHFNWTHGYRPFDESDQSCLRQLNEWQEKAKTSKFYQNAIYTWTDLDARKRQCTRDYSLNWLCFYTIEDFTKWYKELNNEQPEETQFV